MKSGPSKTLRPKSIIREGQSLPTNPFHRTPACKKGSRGTYQEQQSPMLNVPLSSVVMNPLSGERVCVHHPKIRESSGISSLSSQAIEHKSRNQKVPQIRSKVLDIRATQKPFYHLVSILKPTDSEQVDEKDRPKTQIVCQFSSIILHDSTGCKRIGLQIIHRNYFELQPISHLAIITPFKETYTTRQLYLHLVYINQQKLNCTHILCNSRN